MVYLGPQLEEKLKVVTCLQCGETLSRTARAYPETFRDKTGALKTYLRPREMPVDDQSVVRDFDQLY
jgi:hypothetical protein